MWVRREGCGRGWDRSAASPKHGSNREGPTLAAADEAPAPNTTTAGRRKSGAGRGVGVGLLLGKANRHWDRARDGDSAGNDRWGAAEDGGVAGHMRRRLS